MSNTNNEHGKKLFLLLAAVRGAIAQLDEASNDAYKNGCRDWQSGDVPRCTVEVIADMLREAVDKSAL